MGIGQHEKGASYEKYAAKILSLVLCLSLVSACLTPAYAAAAGERSDLAQYIDYANSLLPSLSRLPDTDLPGEDLFLSQPLEILNDNDDTNYAFFLFHESTCVGELVVTRLGGEFAASFLAAELPRVSAAYAGEVPVCLVSGEQALLLCSDTGAEVIVGELAQTAYALRANAAEAVAARAQKEPLTLAPVAPVAAPQSSVLPSQPKTLPVEHVPNTSVQGVGICWAAATASIIRYRMSRRDLTAKNIYDLVSNNVAGTGGVVAGTQQNVLLALNSYGAVGYTATANTNGALPFSTVVSSIDSNYPIYMAISGTMIKDGEPTDVYHAVVLCGYNRDSGFTDFYQIMDPTSNPSNSKTPEGKVWITINRNTYAFTYPTSGWGTYTDWYRSIYPSCAS